MRYRQAVCRQRGVRREDRPLVDARADVGRTARHPGRNGWTNHLRSRRRARMPHRNIGYVADVQILGCEVRRCEGDGGCASAPPHPRTFESGGLMSRRNLTLAIVVALAAGATALLAQQAPADVILTNGKIITVDERFSIAQAVAVRGDRIVAVGGDQDIARLAGPATRRIDLRGRAIIPGLIDNHMHLLRAGTTWRWEVRWDGVGSRKQALELLRARAAAAPAGEWIYNLGGWAIEQFADDSKPLTREELDRVAPGNPVLLQASYYEAYLNSRALQTLGIEEKTPAEAWLVRDAAGRPTGQIREAGVRVVAGRVPTASGEQLESSTRLMFRDLNKMGLTAFGSAGCEANVLPLYRRLADQSQLSVRTFCISDRKSVV